MCVGMERRAPAHQGQQRAGSMLPPIPRLPNPPLIAGAPTTSQAQRAAACTVQPWQQSQRPPVDIPRQAGTPSLGSSARDVTMGSRPVTPPLRTAASTQQMQHRITAGQSPPSSQRLVAQGASCPLLSADDAMVGGREVPVEIATDGLPYLPMQLGSPATPEERGAHAAMHGVHPGIPPEIASVHRHLPTVARVPLQARSCCRRQRQQQIASRRRQRTWLPASSWTPLAVPAQMLPQALLLLLSRLRKGVRRLMAGRSHSSMTAQHMLHSRSA